jgi:hypothetical protein
MSTWIREGQHVQAAYLAEYIVTGTITESRVKYGGKVQHTLKLDKPFDTPRWRSEPRDVLLIDEEHVQEVLSTPLSRKIEALR